MFLTRFRLAILRKFSLRVVLRVKRTMASGHSAIPYINYFTKWPSAQTRCAVVIFLVCCVGERPWWPIQSPNIRRKKKVKG